MTVDTPREALGEDAIPAIADRIKQAGESSSRAARDPVNLPMINNWVEALGDGNPVYTSAEQAAASVHGGLVAPPAMAQVWTMPGLRPVRDTDDPLYAMMGALDELGYTSVVATNCEQTYHRYLRHGEQVAVTARLESVVGPKRTGLGEGWFVTTRNVWYVGSEPVAEMLFRVLKFRPPQQEQEQEPPKPQSQPAPGAQILPPINRDTAYFWEGAAEGELRIQRCGQCGLLRHPPGPMCPECGSTARKHFVACGHGEVYSYVVHHHPPIPGKELPIVIALVELDEGVRMLGELHGIDPGEVAVGLRVEVGFQRLTEEVTMPFWRPRQDGGAA
ncbi:OB-fold domain-containing protein [Saccharopolyspora sp. HNM0986]|uniref:bifunctional MaoC family dehydratase N-terminal/OB-fold nucleic acid binding domain-containing protein n=1 Tax=Saccharopolyspora galaxeae TaxID=2781241 RepID=UPI00190B1BA2|nr:bifunctional MaoC family dehydratase N-terminal/OB-fold nucleic acid binding domain-containing protein [Saccharopolyspora sp. HNM0986]MBK0866569.1 OB-fold domain-containing protein [Saccharopolyspora sp. HNM0986]